VGEDVISEGCISQMSKMSVLQWRAFAEWLAEWAAGEAGRVNMELSLEECELVLV
jgi:hypothetical protein